MLILHNPADPASRYSHFLAAILRGEGYADLQENDLAGITATSTTGDLARHDLVLLPRCALTWEEIDLLTQYVAAGGVLIAFQPDYQLVRRFGLEPTFGGAVSARMTINTRLPILAALCDEAVDIVVPTVHWRIPDGVNATPLATLTQEGPEFGVVHAALALQIEQGTVVLFAYDLPHTIARLRQGNPENSDLGLTYCDDANRTNELFVGQLDPAQLHLPQADIHSAFLGRVIDSFAPRPRLWYYPRIQEQSAMIMTSDEDWSTLEQWQSLIAGLRKRNAQCTFFMVADSRIDKRWVHEWEAEGHVFSVHPALTADYTRGLPKPPHHRHFMRQMLEENIARHQAEYQRPVNTIRQHRVRWLGYVECAQIEAELGVRMDCNTISVKPYYIGYVAGSARPLPFVDTDGTVIPIYQQAAQWTEECLIHDTMYISLKWTAEKAIAVSTQLVREAATRFYTPICFNSHPVSYHTYSSPLTDAAWDQAVELGVPILSADAWLAWTEARDGVTLTAHAHGYTLACAKSVATLTLLLPPGVAVEPTAAAARQVGVTLWGQPYTALTLTNLAAGEQMQLTTQTTGAPKQQ
jgi:hypothetical protein